MHFTPTGSSWINQVERWFAYLTDQLVRRGVHKSVARLEADVRRWIAAWNADPKPFVWTKTAEEILESLSRYCSRISGQDTRSSAVCADRSVPLGRYWRSSPLMLLCQVASR
jgi:hypothetical protein